MVDAAAIEQWVSIAAGIATVGIIFLLWRTVKEMQETSRLSKVQLELRFRPWIGPSSGIELLRTTPEGKQQFVITIKNYGQAPASNVVAVFKMEKEMTTRDILRRADGMDKFNLGPLLPYMEKRYWFFIDSDVIQKAKDGNAQIFVALYFAYEFTSVTSGYGMISQYNTETSAFVHKDMWVD